MFGLHWRHVGWVLSFGTLAMLILAKLASKNRMPNLIRPELCASTLQSEELRIKLAVQVA
jgi:hypothetical protein